MRRWTITILTLFGMVKQFVQNDRYFIDKSSCLKIYPAHITKEAVMLCLF